ncbi:MAG: homoserine dehydrogenase [Rhodanobacteraceae bacterium]|nr:homoserine dehydrogenase [Rhodanobacteraceae bacterium]
MSAVLASLREADRVAELCLLGTGGVGKAVLNRLAELQDAGVARHIALVAVANSRCGQRGSTLQPRQARDPVALLSRATSMEWVDDLFSVPGSARRIVIDATASDAVAARHAHWLAQGIDVVTANKLGQGASLLRWQAIRAAQSSGRARYGDAATVGAGLPLLRTLRALTAGGDRITSISGVLSGSLAWLFDRYDGSQPFSALVREARDLGYTEPDPRDDLSGADVCRKLLILARAAGIALSESEIKVTPLFDAALALATHTELDTALSRLDAPLRLRLDAAKSRNVSLRVVARWREGTATVGLETLAFDDELAHAAGTDNRVVIHSTRYQQRPLGIQGPGAGADITAAALLDDVLSITAA